MIIFQPNFVGTRRTSTSTTTTTTKVVLYSSLLDSVETTTTSATTTTTTTTILIALWTLAFASTHIGLSAIRQTLIDVIGTTVEPYWVNQTGLTLPDIWPGDDQGGQQIFPTREIAGRQLYRILYTIISFATLGMAVSFYFEALVQSNSHANNNNQVLLALSTTTNNNNNNNNMMMMMDPFLLWIAATCWGISIASLFNPSPLSLVPVYETKTKTPPATNASKKFAVANNNNNNNNNNTRSISIIRNDKRKLQAVGLTRITRHPLILPVVPWGIATAFSMGGHKYDFALFGILSIYAIAGCYAQDLRISKQEGSVGTVFAPDDSTLQDFFQTTSFLPFVAILQGRQSWKDTRNELSWLALVTGIGIGYPIQKALLTYLSSIQML